MLDEFISCEHDGHSIFALEFRIFVIICVSRHGEQTFIEQQDICLMLFDEIVSQHIGHRFRSSVVIPFELKKDNKPIECIWSRCFWRTLSQHRLYSYVRFFFVLSCCLKKNEWEGKKTMLSWSTVVETKKFIFRRCFICFRRRKKRTFEKGNWLMKIYFILGNREFFFLLIKSGKVWPLQFFISWISKNKRSLLKEIYYFESCPNWLLFWGLPWIYWWNCLLIDAEYSRCLSNKYWIRWIGMC